MRRMQMKNKTANIIIAVLLAILAVLITNLLFAKDGKGGIQMIAEDFVLRRLNPVRIFLGEVPIAYGKDLDKADIDIYSPEAPKNVPDEILIKLENAAENSQREFFVEAGHVNVLIYHTHTQEAYRIADGDEYKATGTQRTSDNNKNVVYLGEMLKEELESYGFNVIHNTTDHEPPKLSTAYSRSLETMKKELEANPGIDIFIDLHRDAAGEALNDDVVMIDGKRCARMMFVVGTGEKYDTKPDYDSNYLLASLITKQLENTCEGMTRPVRVKTGRYNQHLSPMSLLIELGHNANTFSDAKNSIKYLAQAIAATIDVR